MEKSSYLYMDSMVNLDQGFNNLKELQSQYRILAPSRFGYLGSSVKGKGSPKDQAEALLNY